MGPFVDLRVLSPGELHSSEVLCRVRRRRNSQPINIEPKIRRVSAEKLITALAGADLRGLPKHLQLSTAIVDLVRSGSLEAGDQIPPEQQLAQYLGMSLGTIQKALNRLAIDGLVVREHGRGTLVSYADRA